MRTWSVSFFAVCFLCSAAENQGQRLDPVPIYKVTVVAHTTKAVSYRPGGVPVKIGFQGTVLLPEARGEATVKSRQGATEVDAKIERLSAPTRFGPEYLTYVLWAITPDGRPTNLGELLADHADKSRLRATTELQTFALIATAEPYAAVTQPSSVVVLENVIPAAIAGRVEEIDAKYELLQRGSYTYDVSGARTQRASAGKVSMDEYEALLQLYQARNAIGLAKSAGADRYALSTIRKAEQRLQQAEEGYRRKLGRKAVVMSAREAAQAAEDARLIALERRENERLAAAQSPSNLER